MEVSWPAAHDELKKMKLAGDFAKDLFDPASPTTVPGEYDFTGNDGDRQLNAGDTKNLEIEFTVGVDVRSEADFTLKVTFSNGDVVMFN